MSAERNGWAVGDRIPETSPYLTILGSYYTRPEFYPTELEARAALAAHPQYSNPYMRLEVRHVIETGRTVFRISGL